MKKIFIAFILFFAIASNAQTQKTVSRKVVTTEKLTPEMAAKKNVADLEAFTPIDSKTKTTLENVFISKYKTLTQNGELSEMRKSVLSQSISSQIESILGKETFAKVKSNTKLYESLIK